MTTQFIRLNCYGVLSGKRRKPHENANDILDEAARISGSAPHVRKPLPPVHLYGIPLGSVRNRVAEFAGRARDRRGARLRSDGTILYAIVVSYPRTWRQINCDEEIAPYKRWREAAIEWLLEKFGIQLQAVVEHTDERQPHLHAFVIPPLCPRNRIDHRLHPGHTAREAVLGSGGDRLAGERAYRDGMRSWQDDFHKVVSLHFGHERIGPRRKRFRRDVALMRQSSDRFLQRVETLTQFLAQRLDAHPLLATFEERAEIETMATLFRAARHRLLSGHSDALETLETALVELADTHKLDMAGGNKNPDDMPGAEHPEWVGCDDPGPDDVDDIDHDDDPDPEAGDDRDFDGDEELDPDDGYELDHLTLWKTSTPSS